MGGGGEFWDFMGDTAVMRGDIELMGVPPSPPTRENPERMEGFLEQIARHMGLSSQVSVDTEPGPGSKPQRPGPTLGPHHNGALLKRSMDLGRRRDDDEVSFLASN